MKILIIRTFVLFFFSFFMKANTLKCQTLRDLDNKNGFKEFKIGEPYSKWSSQLKYIGLKNDNQSLKVYRYMGNCCDNVFDFKVEVINLIFRNNKLSSIEIALEKFQKEYEVSGVHTKFDMTNFEILNNSFMRLFGKPTSVDADKETGAFYSYWQGEKILLATKFLYICFKCGDQAWVFVESLEDENERLKSGF